MKKQMAALLTMAAVVAMSSTALADSWQWIDVNGDGVQECYYFTDDGNFLKNTVTPDGYQVDAAGRWVENGVVQTQGGATAQTSGLVGFQNGTYKVYSVFTTDDDPFLVTVANGTLTLSGSQWGTYETNGGIYVGATGFANPVTYNYVESSYIEGENVLLDIYKTQDPNYTMYSLSDTIFAGSNGYIYDYDPTKDTCDYAYEPENIHREIMAAMNQSLSQYY